MPQGLSQGTNLVLYADDTKIWRQINSIDDHIILQNDIDYLNQWSIANKMKFHPSKCKVLTVSLSHLPPISFTYSLGHTNLVYSECEKDLGVDITPKLNWKSQCDRLYTKASQQLGIAKRNCFFVQDLKSRRALYLSLIRSQFENCSIIWRPTNDTLQNKLERIQKRAIKWILSEENRSYSSMEVYIKKCKEVDILPLSAKFDLNDLIFFHKIVYKLCPVELPSYLTFYQGYSRLRTTHLDSLSIVSSISPRVPQNVTSSRSSSNPLERSFFYRTHLMWNRLGLEIRQIDSSASFKDTVIKHLWKSLIENSNQSIQDIQDFEDDRIDIDTG